MTKRRLLLIAGPAAAFAAILGVLALLPPRPGVTKANFGRIQDGMTAKEVAEILGEQGTAIPSVGVRTFAWPANDGGLVTVRFDANDQAEQISFSFPTDEAFIQKIRRSLDRLRW